MRARALASFSILVCTLASGSHSLAQDVRSGGNERKGRKTAAAQPPAESGHLQAETFAGLELRGIGPAIASGRVVDFAVDPRNRKAYYVATASGGVWKTTNAGTTWVPIFDDQGSYSIGCVTLDPAHPLTVWVGTGENNSQRSVGYGDGVYRSRDGGTSWQNMGLRDSEHIGMIRLDPRDSRVVYVAAQGPLWRSGGERGLYKSTDGGESWTRILAVDEHTGVSEIHLDPRNPDVLYAVAYQRQRKVWTLIDGGPGSGLYKSWDAGASWTKLERGLPKVELGRIGLAIAPAAPDTLYAIVEAQDDEGGVFRSTDGGASWEKRSDYVSSSPQYYQELVADPRRADRVYSLDTFLQVSEDGGKTWSHLGQDSKHVDEHALWIDPTDTDYLLSGNDGGIYESFDHGGTWHFKANLPITQFYKIAVDDDRPFYNVYGGTQDNNTLGGPSRTVNVHGITNREWFVTVPGDGFQPRVDPTNPDIVYSQAQYGDLARFDRRTGELLAIRPLEDAGDEPLRWNWDSPLVLSPHSPTRLYYAAQRVFRSDDRGDSWHPVSGDLSRGLDRNGLEIMGRVWSVDAVAKSNSTSAYGTITALAESPLVEGLLFAGTDDGLVQVREPGSEEWRRVERLPGVPELAYIARLEPSRHQADTVYVAANNHKDGDFRPYLLTSSDRGRSWRSIAGDLPERGSAWVVVEDDIDPALLFAGTEFALYFTTDGGSHWIRLQGGFPTIAVRDLQIQTRESDLVVGTFGRGFYILDDYGPLRGLREEDLLQPGILFPVKGAWMYIEAAPLGDLGKGNQGTSFYTAPNPPFGAVFTYYLRKDLETRKEMRREREREAGEKGTSARYPSIDELRAEDRERDPVVELVVEDEEGSVVRRLSGPPKAGFHRVAWDLRLPPSTPTSLEARGEQSIFDQAPRGSMVVPGSYRVHLRTVVGEEVQEIGEPQTFDARPLGTATLPAADRQALAAFERKTARLQRAVLGAARAVEETAKRIEYLRAAWRDTPGAAQAGETEARLRRRLDEIDSRLRDLRLALEGDRTRRSRNVPDSPSIVDRVQTVVQGHWSSTSSAPATLQHSYEVAAEAFAPVLEDLHRLVEAELAAVERELEAAGAPWTPGRIPTWEPE